jgi:hypothetical protein
MLLGILLFVSSAFSADIIIKNKTTVESDFSVNVIPYISDEISIRVSTGIVETNRVLIGVKYKISDTFSTSFNLFLQNQREHSWILDYGPMIKLDIIF